MSKIRRRFVLGFLILFLFISLSIGGIKGEGGKDMSEKLILSSVFGDGKKIPARYTCDGLNISPPLRIEGVDPKAKGMAIVMDDPDAPMGVWDHWVIWNIDPKMSKIEEGVPNEEDVLGNAVQGANTAGMIGYMGPCPPSGTHTYRFKLYALDTTIDLKSGSTKKMLEKAMEGHIIQEALLRGLYR